ncbi:hypothetical protein [Granulicella arctica]|uniref:Uncharacterized protein n=1 Tax=Granulicella arctica TaxID=940613 RepID=A0A7Y9PH99_9BACT|nr:hypothetical protein [Granulicella arctica]NYF79161.1 hypothetical protein [Granulicella arctica]
MATEREMIHECQVKRRRVRAAGGYEPFWKLKTVIDAIADSDTEFRCKDCFGPVKLNVRTTADEATRHMKHKSKSDSEYCPSGIYFQNATDGREPRLSQSPVR